jgi:hypothetical protein
MTERSRCAHCQRFFRPDPRVKEQRYCGRKGCQLARKSRWQREKMARDEDYQENHERAQRAWADSNPDYWRRYRASHPEYRDRNRRMQKERDARRREQNLAKMDALKGRNHIESGTYLLVPPSLAKKDASGQKVVIISEGFDEVASFLQRKTRLPAVARSP